MKSAFRKIGLVVIVLLVIAAIYPAYHYYLYFESHVSTDDAYVDGTVALVSSRLPGTVAKLYIEENWGVKGGDLLLTLDPRDYEVRVMQAQAQLARARQSVDELYAQLQAASAGVNLAGSQLREAQLDYNRAKALRAQNVVSIQFYDQATTSLRVAVADEALAQHQLQQARAALGGDMVDHARYDRPIVQQAEAALEAAKLDLSYTQIRAPLSGIVTRKSVHVGNRIQPGEPLMAIVPINRLYVTANFKETQLTDVRVGQPADIEADIYPGYVYKGHIDSISVGTGAAFALLPPENATGNWVKVVQRVPVKVVLNEKPPPDKPLRMGLSIEVTVNISDTRGPLLSSTLQHSYEHHQGTMSIPPEDLQFQPPSISNLGNGPVAQPALQR
ncbi:MAG: HlyD family secretion protein [Deltaproteobacteria bacterium]|nr:HlyD family secretion protein [Deltaproteobacteria bacterium]